MYQEHGTGGHKKDEYHINKSKSTKDKYFVEFPGMHGDDFPEPLATWVDKKSGKVDQPFDNSTPEEKI